MELAHPGDSGAGASGGGARSLVGPYMLIDFVDDLPLETPEHTEVQITTVEAREENLYVGTSAHELLHFVLLPPTPAPDDSTSLPFPSHKPTFILASRIQPPLTSGNIAQSQQPYIKRILLLPGPSKILVLSSTGLLSFWSYPELSPAYGGTVKVGGTNFVGALDLNEVDKEEADALGGGGYGQGIGSVGRRTGRAAVDNSKMVMVMGKKGVKMVKVKEEEPRLVKNVECPSLVFGVRRGPIACVATNTDYSLLHLEIGGIIPLFPILSSNLSPSAEASQSTLTQEASPSTPAQEDVNEPSQPPRPVRRLSSSPRPPVGSETSDNDSSAHEKAPSRRASSSAANRPHSVRSSSLQQRSRSEIISGRSSSALSVPDDPASKHTRASSTGSIQRRPSGSIGKNSPLSKSVGRASGKDVAQDVSAQTKRTSSPTPTTGGNAGIKSPTSSISRSSKLSIPPPGAPARSATSSRNNTPNPTPPGSATSSHPKKAQSNKGTTKPTSTVIASLKPHIVSPTENEFLLITGTSPTDPGVGMFVNNDGDPTRGTIQLTQYPEEVVLDGSCIIALLPAPEEPRDVRLLETIRIQDDESSSYMTGGVTEISISATTNRVGIGKVMGLQEVVIPEVGKRLRFDRVKLLLTDERNTSEELEEWEMKRTAEELEAAIRISKIEGKVVLFSGKKVWRLLPSPIAVRLDSRLPSPVLSSPREVTPEAKKDADKRRATILSVLKEVHGLEPTTERMFHEIAYIKQKCGVLLLAEFLSLPREEDKRQFPTELLATERALIDGSLDPRIVVSLFPGFEDELREGKNGVWIYGGIKEIVENILKDRKSQEHLEQEDESKEPEWSGRRDLLLLLRRYLSAWRQKKGFGSVSQADEKEVFWTIDAALMRCLLFLEATRSPSALQHMAGEVDVRQELYKMCDYPSSVECFERCVYLLERFKRLYVLSILYQSKKMSREVLETWKRLFESGDEKALAEFGEGEDRIADYLLAKKDRDLVKEYGLWLAKRNPRFGIKVFADERARVKWEAQEVLDMFREHAPTALRSFVEYLVIEKKNHAYSNELLSIYLGTITESLSSSSPITGTLRSSYEAYRALSLPKPTYRKFIEENIVSVTVAGDATNWWNQRLMFLDLLASSTDIGSAADNDTIVEKLEPFKELLVAEMIVLYGRAGKHDEALHLLVHELRDFDGSVEYCLDGGKLRHASSNTTKRRDKKASIQRPGLIITREDQERLFSLLLVETLKLEDWLVRQEWVEMLLERWGGWLDPVHVISVIPDTYSIALISNFLLSALRNLVREKNESIITRAIRRGENLRVNAEFVDKCDELGPTIQEVDTESTF